uniref:DUF4939 domain-containing protein n=1 Tax=Mola mola TaxID=94237 RepID=A0A3Q3XEQ6_MOLML
MDSAEWDPVRSVLKAQGARLHKQEEQLELVRQEMLEAAERHESAFATLSAQRSFIIDFPVSPVSSHSFHLSSPERFSGQSGDCCPFITQCELYFEFNASAFSSDRAKSAFLISYLTGRARSWATAEWSHRSAVFPVGWDDRELYNTVHLSLCC